MEYDAIVFDNDGVLTTPTDTAVLRRAAAATFADVGVDDPDPDHVEELIVGVSPDWLDEVCAAYGVDPAQFWARRDANAAAVQKDEIRDGRKQPYDDVDAATGLDAALGIVSSNQHETIEFLVDYFDLEDAFDTYYGREPTVESLHRKKPEPHYVERALSDLGTENALYVGDSESDLVAADRAGIDAAFVRRPHRREYELSVEPTYEVESLTELAGL